MYRPVGALHFAISVVRKIVVILHAAPQTTELLAPCIMVAGIKAELPQVAFRTGR